MASASNDYDLFKKQFESAYNIWSRNITIPRDLLEAVESFELTTVQFEKLTRKKENQRYLALYDRKIKFYELPSSPHGSIIGIVNAIIASQINGPSETMGFVMCNDDGNFSFTLKTSNFGCRYPAKQ